MSLPASPRNTPARLKACGQLAAAALIAVTGLAIAATAVGHALDPAHVGLWSGPHALFFGALDARIHAHQLPAGTLYLVAFVAVALAGLIVRELVGYARAGLRRDQAA